MEPNYHSFLTVSALDEAELARVKRHLGAADAVSAQRALRVLLEIMVKRIARQHCIDADSMNLLNLVKTLGRQNIFGVEAEALAHRIRINGNRAIHRSDGTMKKAIRDLDALALLASTFGPPDSPKPASPVATSANPPGHEITPNQTPGLQLQTGVSPISSDHTYTPPSSSPLSQPQTSIHLQSLNNEIPWSRTYRAPNIILGRNALRGSGITSKHPQLAQLEATELGWVLNNVGESRIEVDGELLSNGQKILLRTRGTLSIANFQCEYQTKKEAE